MIVQDDVAVITGAGGGIGEGIARVANARGMKLVLADIDGDRVQAVADDISRQGGTAIAVATDVRDGAQVDALAARAYDAFGRVDLLVNNAGIELLGFMWEISEADWRRTIDINILGVINGIRAFVPRMIASGTPAAIANLSSLGGVGMTPIQTGYIMSKHAVLSISECLALELELANVPIRVSAVMPGPVDTRIFDDAPRSDATPFVKAHWNSMRAMLRDHGLSPDEAGRIILDGIARGDFWVSTHPELLVQATERRAAHLQDRTRPVLNPEMRRQMAEFDA